MLFISKDYEKKQSKQQTDLVWLLTLTCLAFYVRIIQLNSPNYVTEIELETTNHVNWYLNGNFFIGKMPPLSSLISYFITKAVGYDQQEKFLYAGQPFIDFPMIALRRFSVVLGTSLVPLVYLTMRNMGHERLTATFAAILLILENGIVTQSRYATADIYVLFFTALGIWLHTKEQTLMTSIALGCALSSKWTGFLATPIILTSTLSKTWNNLCNKNTNTLHVLRTALRQFVILTCIPLLTYLAVFQIHFWLTPNSGDHDILLKPQLRHSLMAVEPEPSQARIAYGSQIVIRHDGTVGGYLHSHDKRFKGGTTHQQQITLYPHIDINNLWTVHKVGVLWNDSQPIEYVHNLDRIRLEHVASSRKLHSHDYRPQLMTKKEHSEVTAYGDRFIEDTNDYWTLKILTDQNVPLKDKTVTWKALDQRFRLQHWRGCMLISHPIYQDDEQQEVTCMASAGTHVSPWVVDSAYHSKLEGEPLVHFEPISALNKFKEVHKLMSQYSIMVYDRLQTSSTNTKQEPLIQSFFKHTTFPIWSQLTGYSSHLLIQPSLPTLTLACTLTFVVLFALAALLAQRQIKQIRVPKGADVLFFMTGFWLWLMGLKLMPQQHQPQTLSDALGAVYMGIGLVTATLRTLVPRRLQLIAIALFILLVAVQFKQLSNLVYGTFWDRQRCEHSGVDLDCLLFPGQDDRPLFTRVQLPGGQGQMLEYTAGQEWEIQQEKQRVQQAAFSKALASATVRYHRVLPTPAMSPEDAAQWAKRITSAALQREKKAAKKKANASPSKKKKANKLAS
ncbi:MAG: Dolichyl-phosphate-mannose-protein mannosyltransferase-domain-containing protein [Benjaminiella poitrasii]|nr:MAG: Dolichyl-phosphate-mannose-protein mannosyltransferase-domain-containing protein [Benjaminiella poitrasii]